MELKDLTGLKFGRWTVLMQSGMSPAKNKVKWLCVCDCGTRRRIIGGSLTRGASKSCGCLLKDFPSGKTHGYSKTPTFRAWASMTQRCSNPNDNSYPNYGGRGISVCKQWKESFEAFLFDMGETPKGLTLDRIDNEGDYEPDNCRWATRIQQAGNTRRSVLVEYNGETMSVAAASRLAGVNPSTVYARVNSGWDSKDLLSPVTV